MNTTAPTPEQDRILQQARAGDPQVIARLLNYKLNPEGINAKVTWNKSRLQIDLAAAEFPQPQRCTQIIERGLKKLQIPGLSQVEVIGQRSEQSQPLWRQTLSLASTALAIDLAAWLESGSSLQDAVVNLPAVSSRRSEITTLPGPEVQEQKYLNFQLGIENPALLPVESIQEVLYLAIAHVLPVPDMPDCVLGIYNWRGEMLWILDLNHLLGLGGLDLEALSTVTVIILKSSTHLLGVMVQTIDEITPYDPTLLQPPDGLFPPELEPYITGYLRETSSIVLDSEAIFHAPVLQRR
jgi:chemotaxis signal transduction protein